jgi:hypothetical protein
VANATSVEGTAYVTRADGRQSILARGSALGVGDALTTTRNSTVRLRFTDGGETAIRPDSRITVQAYNYSREEPQSDNLILGLLKGGLRAITGSIGKRGNVDAYKLNVNTATIGIRGTDYTARLCNNDCASGTERSTRPNSGPPVIARLMQAQGAVTVERDTRQIEVAPGAALYASDRVATAPGGSCGAGFPRRFARHAQQRHTAGAGAVQLRRSAARARQHAAAAAQRRAAGGHRADRQGRAAPGPVQDQHGHGGHPRHGVRPGLRQGRGQRQPARG